MSEVIKLRRRSRALALGCLALAAVAVFGWLRAPAGPEVVAADTEEHVAALETRLSAANRAERMRLLDSLARGRGARASSAIIAVFRAAQTDRVRLAAIARLGAVGDDEAIRELTAIADSGSHALRGAAIRALGATKAPGAVDELLTLLEGAPRWRDTTIRALGNAGGPRATTKLIALAADAEEAARIAAVGALGATGAERAFAPLKTLVLHHDARLRRAAVSALGQLGRPAAKQLLITLATRPPVETQRVAVSALSSYAGANVDRALATLARNRDPSIARAALGVLGRSDSATARRAMQHALRSGRQSDRSAAVRSLARTGTPEARATLIDMMSRGEETGTIAWELARMNDPEARAALIAAARDGRVDVQRSAVYALRGLPGKDVQNTLRSLVRRGNPRIAAQALRQIAESQGPKARGLLEELYRDGSHHVRAAAFSHLAKLGDPRSRALLVKAARSDDHSLTRSAVDGLARIDGKKAAATLTDLMRNGSRNARRYAAQKLAEIGGPAARRALVQAFKDDKDGRGNFGYALGRLRDPQSKIALRRLLDDGSLSSRKKTQIVSALNNAGDRESVLKAASHSDATVARAALSSLGQHGGAAAERILNEALRSTDAGRRGAALSALGRLATPSATKTLISALDDPKTAGSAAGILANIGGKPAYDALRSRFRSSSATERRNVINRLGPRDPRARALLVSALDDRDTQVVTTAARRLARSSDPQVSARLLALMQSSPHTQVRKAIAQQLRYSRTRLYRDNQALIERIRKGG